MDEWKLLRCLREMYSVRKSLSVNSKDEEIQNTYKWEAEIIRRIIWMLTDEEYLNVLCKIYEVE